ncbi:MAG: sensor histidine kinase [Planctomycetota bacterium]|jgi:signal transduction histidine kinase
MTAATRAQAWAVGVSIASAITGASVVPILTPLGSDTGVWQRMMLGGGAVFCLALAAWSHRRLRPIRDEPAPSPMRRLAAHDYPFLLARGMFVGAVLAGAFSGAWLVGHPAFEVADAIVTGVVTYLMLLLFVLGQYLGSRAILRDEAAGPSGAVPVLGMRQSIPLRLAFAVQLPVVVCVAGIVLVEQSGEQVYAAAVGDFYQQQYADALDRVLAATPEGDRAELLPALVPPPGMRVVTTTGPGGAAFALVVGSEVGRPLHLRLPPYVLLVVVALLAAALGRWLAAEVTHDMRRVQHALAGLRPGGRQDEAGWAVALDALDSGEWPRPASLGDRVVAFRETEALVAAFEATIAGFAAQREALGVAAERLRRAEQAKGRFLAHISHELKSPLNSILGFSEVLLAGIDGPLARGQREHLVIVWRSGEHLLRFIQALLDLARLEQGPAAATAYAIRPTVNPVSELCDALERQIRPDPTDTVRMALAVDPALDRAAEWWLDVPRLAAVVVSLAGLIIDRLESGEVSIELAPGAAPEGEPIPLRIDIGLRAEMSTGDPADQRYLVRAITRYVESEDPRSAPSGSVGTALALAKRVIAAHDGRFDVTPREVECGWPRFVLWLRSDRS